MVWCASYDNSAVNHPSAAFCKYCFSNCALFSLQVVGSALIIVCWALGRTKCNASELLISTCQYVWPFNVSPSLRLYSDSKLLTLLLLYVVWALNLSISTLVNENVDDSLEQSPFKLILPWNNGVARCSFSVSKKASQSVSRLRIPASHFWMRGSVKMVLSDCWSKLCHVCILHSKNPPSWPLARPAWELSDPKHLWSVSSWNTLRFLNKIGSDQVNHTKLFGL